MAERKVKPEIMHLMILDNCDHKCNLCCNKMYDIDKIPVATVEEMKTVHTVCITGGEPFMSNINIDRFAFNLKNNFQMSKMYTFIHLVAHLCLTSTTLDLIFWMASTLRQRQREIGNSLNTHRHIFVKT